MPDDIKLPAPYCYVHEYDSCLGLHRSFYPGPWNGMHPSRTVPVYTADQARAAVEAALATKQEKPTEPKLRNQLIGALQALRANRAHYDSAEGQAAMDKALAAVDTYIYAAVEAERATITEDMKNAVRWAPSSAHWSERLREFFGPDAREGITALERQLYDAQALASRMPLTDEQIKDLCLKAGSEASPDVPLYVVVSRAIEAAHGIPAPKGGSDLSKPQPKIDTSAGCVDGSQEDGHV